MKRFVAVLLSLMLMLGLVAVVQAEAKKDLTFGYIYAIKKGALDWRN